MSYSETDKLENLIRSLEKIKGDVNMAVSRLDAVITNPRFPCSMIRSYPNLCDFPICPSDIQSKLLQVRWDLSDDIHRLEKGLKDDNS